MGGFTIGFVMSSWWGSSGFTAAMATEITFVGFHDEVVVEITLGFARDLLWVSR